MRLIIVDGLDGVGKDTHARFIKKRYESKGETVVIRSHPESDNIFGLKTKKALFGAGKFNRLKASVFYAFDVLRSLRRYYRRNSDYDTLIMVRYLMGTAYLPRGLGRYAYRVFEKFVPVSPYMFFLDAQPEILFERVKDRKKMEMFETYIALVRVRKKALELAEGWIVIDTSQSIEETRVHIEEVLDTLDGK